MNKYNKLVKNSAILAAGTIGSHFISFAFIRFYTELLSPEEYGIIDIITTSTSILIPIISLSILESVFRFSMDNSDSRDVLINGAFVALCGSLALTVVGIFANSGTIYSDYWLCIILFVVLSSENNICAQYIRGTGNTLVFAVAGIVKTISIISCNLILLLGLRLKIDGYLMSLVISEVVSMVYLLISSGALKKIKWHVNYPLLKNMMRYSIPLIPNSLSWMIMGAADKYTIFYFLGSSFNGVYAVSQKIPSIVAICNNLFFQAWQLSAVEEYKDEGRTKFYADVFDALSFILFSVAALLLLLLKPMTKIMVSSEYGDAWKSSAFLIVGMVFFAFSGFLGTNYIVIKDSVGSLKTTMFGAIINIILNIILINYFGMIGTAIATMCSYFATWIYRLVDTRKYIDIEYRGAALIISIVLILMEAYLIQVESSISLYYSFGVCASIPFLYQKSFIKIMAFAHDKWANKGNVNH